MSNFVLFRLIAYKKNENQLERNWNNEEFAINFFCFFLSLKMKTHFCCCCCCYDLVCRKVYLFMFSIYFRVFSKRLSVSESREYPKWNWLFLFFFLWVYPVIVVVVVIIHYNKFTTTTKNNISTIRIINFFRKKRSNVGDCCCWWKCPYDNNNKNLQIHCFNQKKKKNHFSSDFWKQQQK